ncbi:MAG: hypothetical protein V4819_06450 [Verrucomicrobiota bacterium]
MSKKSKVICVIGAGSLLLFALTGYVCTHGVQENGWLSVAMTSSAAPGEANLAGRTIRIDADSYVKVTTIGRDLNANGTTRNVRIHGDVFCRSKQWFSLTDRAWKHQFLASAARVEKELRAVAVLPPDAVTQMNAELLLP